VIEYIIFFPINSYKISSNRCIEITFRKEREGNLTHQVEKIGRKGKV